MTSHRHFLFQLPREAFSWKIEMGDVLKNNNDKGERFVLYQILRYLIIMFSQLLCI